MTNSRTWSALLAGFWDILAKALLFLSVKYLTGLRHIPAVTTYAAYVGTAGICRNPVLNIMVYPKHRWYEQIMIPEFSGMKFFEPEIFSKKFQFKFLITEKIQVPRLKTSRKVTSKFWNWSISIKYNSLRPQNQFLSHGQIPRTKRCFINEKKKKKNS